MMKTRFLITGLILGLAGSASAASYNLNTNANQEAILSRAANEAGNTNLGLIQKILLAALNGFAATQQAADDQVLSDLQKFATNAAKTSAKNTLEASITKPEVKAPVDQTTAVGATVSLQIVATDADGAPLRYNATGLPTGLQISGSGLVTGKPTTVTGSPFTVTLRAQKGSLNGVFATTTFTWTITQ